MSKAGSPGGRGAGHQGVRSSPLRFFPATLPLCVSHSLKLTCSPCQTGEGATLPLLEGRLLSMPCLWPWARPHGAGQRCC